ncbi:MAG: hypothetical protein SX243_16740 [Acidobacteriota bacterium]|nr:hypothetical protein [Acidobacteriota bacterium]
MQARRFLILTLLLTLAALPVAAQLGSSPLGLQNDLAAAEAGAREQTQPPATLLFYSLPSEVLAGQRTEITARIQVNGERFLEEKLVVQRRALERSRERAVEQLASLLPADLPELEQPRIEAPEGHILELLAERGDLRNALWQLAERAAVRLTVAVDGESVLNLPWESLAQASEGLIAAGGLPLAAPSTVIAYQTNLVQSIELPEEPICGDGYCTEGDDLFTEDCETCPQDCGGPCNICGNNYCGPSESCSSCPQDCGSCPSCPYNLGTEQRTDYLGSSYLSIYCMDSFFGKTYFAYSQVSYKHYTVQLTEECDGSITETVVPGSITYSYAYCWEPLGGLCTYPNGYAGLICGY